MGFPQTGKVGKNERLAQSQPDWEKITMRRILYVLCMGLLCGLSAHSQEAQLSGLITDASGAVVPQASVALLNQDTGVKYQSESNGAGIYAFPFVKPGPYAVTAEKAGFKTISRTGIKLDVSQNARIDFNLALGLTNQVVQVTSSAPLVNTSDATVSEVITGKQVVDLNLNGRNYEALVTLMPGSSPDNPSGSQVKASPFNLTVTGGNSVVPVSFNGGRLDANSFAIDGMDSADDSGGGWSTVVVPDVDSIAEFRISTSNYGADIGKRGSAITEIATKSGTKDFHGTAFEFVRNDALNANYWFANQVPWSGLSPANCGGNPDGPCNAPKTSLKHNDFGYNFGGPFYIPGVYNTGKSKTFFFWTQTWDRYRDGTVLNSNVPTARMRTGDFSECDPKSSNYNAIAASNCTLPINHATGLPFPGDIVPIDPNAKTLLSAFVPMPNIAPIGWESAPNLPSNSRQESLRVDQNVSDKTSLFVRMTQETWSQDIVPTLWSSSVFDTIKTHHALPAKNAVLHLTHSFKPNLMNEFIVGFVHDVQSESDSVGPGSLSGSIAKPSTWTGGSIFAVNKKYTTLPGITVCGGTPFCFSEDPAPWGVPGLGNFSASFHVSDTLVYTVRKHSLKMGLSFLDTHADGALASTNPEGKYSFQAHSPTSTGNALADMYLGTIDSYTEGAYGPDGVPINGVGWNRSHRQDYEPFIQDDWKVSRKLTLNLGVRYYYYTAQHDVSHPSNDADFFPQLYNPAQQAQLNAAGNIVLGAGFAYNEFGNGLVQCGVGGIPLGCRHQPAGLFAPRFGFAFDPTGSGKTSIRGGYGIFYDLGNGEGQSQNAAGNPPNTFNTTGHNIVGYQNVVPGPLPPGSLIAWPENGPWMGVQQFNLMVQHELPGHNFLSVGYVGALGRHLSRNHALNQVPNGEGTVNVPELANTTGCDASGNCNVQNILIHSIEPTIFFAPYRGYNSITTNELSGSSHYNSLQATYRHPVGHGFNYQIAYTWSHAIDNASQSASYGVDDSNLDRWTGNSDFNRTNGLQASYIYDLPFFKNNTNRFLRGGLGGWQVSGITSLYSGLPVDFNCGGTGLASGIGQGMRCNTIGPLRIQKGVVDDPVYGPVPTWFNPAVLQQPLAAQYYSNGEPGMFGYMGRNVLTGPGRNNWDIGVHKSFNTPWLGGERGTLQFRFETYNTFNHPQWDSVNAYCGGNTPAGTPCSGNANNYGNGEVNGTWNPRNVQMGLKFLF